MKTITVMISQVNRNKFAPSIRVLLLFAAFFCCISTLSVFGQRDERTKQQTIDYLNKTLDENTSSPLFYSNETTYRVDDKYIMKIADERFPTIHSVLGQCGFNKNMPWVITSISKDNTVVGKGAVPATAITLTCYHGSDLTFHLVGNYRDEADNIINALKHLVALDDPDINASNGSTSASPTPTPEAPVNNSAGSGNGGAIIISDEEHEKGLAREKEQELELAKQASERALAAKRAQATAKARAARTNAKAAPRRKPARKGTATPQ